MRRKITFLIAALCALMLITQLGEVKGQTRAVSPYVSLTFPDDNSANNKVSGYDKTWTAIIGDYSWTISNFNNNSWNNSWKYIKCGRSGGASTGTIETDGVIDRPVKSVTINIGAITTSKVNSITLYTSDDGFNWENVGTFAKETGEKTITIASPMANLYYKIAGSCQSGSNGVLRIDGVEYNVETFTVDYDCAGGTSDCPSSSVNEFVGSYTLASAPIRDGYSFLGWNDGTSTYAAGASYTITDAVTFTAQWQSLSSPNIVINDGTPLDIANTAAASQIVTVAYNNMSSYGIPTVDLFNDSDCLVPFSDDWFYSVSLSGDGYTALNYSVKANELGERSVYIKVSATYNEETITSVLAATQRPNTFIVTYNANGGIGNDYEDGGYTYGSDVTVLAYNNTSVDFTAPSGKIFSKWNTKVGGTGDSYDANDVIEDITADVTLYAQWVDEPTYTLVEEGSQIIPGAHYIIAGGYDGTVKVMASQGSNNRSSNELTVTSKQIKNPVSSIYKFVLSGSANNWTFYDSYASSKGYLYAASSSSNYLRTEGSLDANGRWSITIDDNGACLIVAQGSNTRNRMRLNGSTFACYGESNYDDYGPIYLFVLDNDTDIHPYSPTTYDEDVTINDVTITPSNKITVSDGATVTLTGTVSCDDPANLVIEDGGQLITNSCIPLTYKKNITSATKDGGWYTISTPVHTSSNTFLEHQSVENLILAPEQYDFFYYDEPSHYWRNYKKHEFDLNVGQGYLYRNNGAELHFAGNNNQATYYEKDLSYASTEPSLLGFNLIGNPYPQNITMSDVTVNNEGTLTGGYVLSNAGAWSADVAATIAPAQGFLVQIDKAGVTARITKPTGGSKSRTNHDYLKFIVANSQYEDAAFALFDKGYGLNKIDHRNADIPMLYIPKDKQNFAIATMSDDTKSFNLNLKAMTTGKYTLSYKATGTYSYLHVIDRLTGEDVDMLLEGEYSFIASPSDAENRFIVRLEYSAGSESPESSVFAYQSGNDIIVNGEGELQIFDMMGRRVSTQYVSGVETINLQLNGVYVFRLNEKTQKIVVK